MIEPPTAVAPLEKRYYVYVFGSPDETAEALQQHAEDLLAPVWVRLHPVDAATAAQIDAWTANGPTKAPE